MVIQDENPYIGVHPYFTTMSVETKYDAETSVLYAETVFFTILYVY